MTRKFLPASLLALLLCLGLLTGCGPDIKVDSVTVATQTAEDDAAPEVASKTEGTLDLDAFTGIEVAVKAADIRLEVGKGYAVTYQLHEKEPLKEAEVVDGVLRFSTGMDPLKLPGGGHWSVVVTVPADAKLEKIQLTTAAGDISFSGLAFTEGTLDTKAGEILLSGVTCDTLEASAIADDITISASQIGTLTAENTADDIEVDGTFNTVQLHSVSGDCELHGAVTTEASLETVSGDIELTCQGGDIQAETVGEIEHNGSEGRGKLHITGEGASIRLKSVSGSIEIETY